MPGSLPGSVRVWMNHGPGLVQGGLEGFLEFGGVAGSEDFEVHGFCDPAEVEFFGVGGDACGGGVDAVVQEDDDEVFGFQISGGECCAGVHQQGPVAFNDHGPGYGCSFGGLGDAGAD